MPSTGFTRDRSQLLLVIRGCLPCLSYVFKKVEEEEVLRLMPFQMQSRLTGPLKSYPKQDSYHSFTKKPRKLILLSYKRTFLMNLARQMMLLARRRSQKLLKEHAYSMRYIKENLSSDLCKSGFFKK